MKEYRIHNAHGLSPAGERLFYCTEFSSSLNVTLSPLLEVE